MTNQVIKEKVLKIQSDYCGFSTENKIYKAIQETQKEIVEKIINIIPNCKKKIDYGFIVIDEKELINKIGSLVSPEKKERFDLKYCEKCIQMTNWENGECAKCKIKKIIGSEVSPEVKE